MQAADAFVPGATIPKVLGVPDRRTPTASTHGTFNPTLEVAPKSTDMER
ncbi:hypothetical protein [Streptomyces sp. NPDC047981]